MTATTDRRPPALAVVELMLDEPTLTAAEAIREAYPAADFYEPAGFGWTPEGYEVRRAMRAWSDPPA